MELLRELGGAGDVDGMVVGVVMMVVVVVLAVVLFVLGSTAVGVVVDLVNENVVDCGVLGW